MKRRNGLEEDDDSAKLCGFLAFCSILVYTRPKYRLDTK